MFRGALLGLFLFMGSKAMHLTHNYGILDLILRTLVVKLDWLGESGWDIHER